MYIAKTFRKRGVKFAPISFLKNINQLPFISPIRFLMGSLNQQENPPAIPYISAKPSRHLPFISPIRFLTGSLNQQVNPPDIPYISAKPSRLLLFIYPIRFLTDSLNQQVNPPAIPYTSVKSSRHLPFIYAIKVLASNIVNPPAQKRCFFVFLCRCVVRIAKACCEWNFDCIYEKPVPILLPSPQSAPPLPLSSYKKNQPVPRLLPA